MRMRKKKNLEKRLEECNALILSAPESPYTSEEIFGNKNALHLEIGCGKGAFTKEIALRHPDINFIAVEMIANVAVSAMEKIKEADIKNVRFIVANAERLPQFLNENSVEKIYLNFSCPFPKRRYEKHRLTHENFLKIYADILQPGDKVCQKTDNEEFFEFSVKKFKLCGWELNNITRNLHKSAPAGENIVTEYEEKFSAQGMPIYALEATVKK